MGQFGKDHYRLLIHFSSLWLLQVKLHHPHEDFQYEEIVEFEMEHRCKNVDDTDSKMVQDHPLK